MGDKWKDIMCLTPQYIKKYCYNYSINIKNSLNDYNCSKTRNIKMNLGQYIDWLLSLENGDKSSDMRYIENNRTFLNDYGLILLHDCLPSEMSHQAVPRYRNFWLGDVWKAIVYFRKDPNLNIFTCNIETGISLIKKEINEQVLDLKIKNCKINWSCFKFNICCIHKRIFTKK